MAKSQNQKDIARARRMQDDYALAEKHFEDFKTYAKTIPSRRRKSQKRAAVTSNPKNEGRVEGFLAGAFVTAMAWLVKGSK